jgi:hypothetical protein
MSAEERKITVTVDFELLSTEEGGLELPTQTKNEIEDTKSIVEAFDAGNVGDLQRFSSGQFGNVKQLATNPFQFVFGTVFKKFGKIGRAGIFVGLGLLIWEIVQFILEEAMKPGRILDRRFKRIASREIIIFTDRQEQEELRAGFKSVITTTAPYLRGGKGQISGNFYTNSSVGLSRVFYDGRAPAVKNNVRTQGLSRPNNYLQSRYSRGG